MRNLAVASMAILMLGLLGGCKKSPADRAAATAQPVSKPEPILRLHWVGKGRLSTDTNAAGLMSVLNLPASARLEQQTLEKLAAAPSRLAGSQTNFAAILLRPLLTQLMTEECYLEIRTDNHNTNRNFDLVLAVRVNDAQALLWRSNLAAAAQSLSGVSATTNLQGWSIKKHDFPNLLELRRVGSWTLVGLGQDENKLLAEMATRAEKGSPVTAVYSQVPDAWLAIEADPQRCSRILQLGTKVPADLPRVSLAVTGDGENVRTRGSIVFPKPLGFELEPWKVPTGLIHDPLCSFTAVQGIKQWLTSLPSVKSLQIDSPPNQIFAWAMDLTPLQAYAAAPLADVTNQVSRMSGVLIDKVSPFLRTNAMGQIERTPSGEGVFWSGLPYMTAFLQPMKTAEGDFAYVSLVPYMVTNNPAPAELLQVLTNQPNMVAYQWELTGPEIDSWIYKTQFARMLAEKPQLPAGSASMAWLQVAKTNLGNCVTTVTKTDSNQLSFLRKSSCGFSSLELHLLADWLESPDFPIGLHTFDATNPPSKRKSSSQPPPAPGK
ncbi:MAG TPA: hypothetical protein VN673_11605 [Clostridia bacterium]|nr:hypothetical protein [Clostridia bacterium]